VEAGGNVEWRACTPGQGDIGHRAVLQAFADGGYDGALSIEAEGPEDDLEAARFSARFFRELIQEIEYEE